MCTLPVYACACVVLCASAPVTLLYSSAFPIDRALYTVRVLTRCKSSSNCGLRGMVPEYYFKLEGASCEFRIVNSRAYAAKLLKPSNVLFTYQLYWRQRKYISNKNAPHTHQATLPPGRRCKHAASVSALRVNINAAQLQHRVRRCVARPRVVYRFRRRALGATWLGLGLGLGLG